MQIKKHAGAAYIIVIIALIFVSMYSMVLVSSLNQAIYQQNTYELQMKAHYLNYEALSITVSALMKNVSRTADEQYYFKTIDFSTEVDGVCQCIDTDVINNNEITHVDEDRHKIGRSKITLTKEKHEYYDDEDALWIVATITTTIDDNRGGNVTGIFSYVGREMILCSNPTVQIYDVDPNTLN